MEIFFRLTDRQTTDIRTKDCLTPLRACARGVIKTKRFVTAVCTKLAILEVVIRLSAHAHISQQIHLARNMAGTSYEPCRTSDVV